MATRKLAVFVFPSASGHINPSLPLARGLITRGWDVKFLSIPGFQKAIEDTGAVFVDRDSVCSQFGIDDVTAMVLGTFGQYNDPSAAQWALNFGSIATQRLLPVYIDWFRGLCPQLVVYCPVLCAVAHLAATHLNIPDVSVLTAAGPGFFDAAMKSSPGASASSLIGTVKANAANALAVAAIQKELAQPDLRLNTDLSQPLICDYYTATNLVTTTAELADELNERDAEWYSTHGKEFVFVGPLLDQAGAQRCGGTLAGQQVSPEQAVEPVHAADVLGPAADAARSGRAIVYVSMGTVLTGDSEEHGWTGTSGSALTGKQLCQAVYRAVFQELGTASDAASSPLIVLAVGPQPDALEGVDVPGNAVYASTVPQVDLLRTARPVVFVTNGGQNSLMESMTVGTPVVVCPGFGDQVGNAAKVEAQGWGAAVKRPAAGGEAQLEELVGEYEAAVRTALRKVLDGQEFTSKAGQIAQGLEKAPGVDSAVSILISVAEKRLPLS